MYIKIIKKILKNIYLIFIYFKCIFKTYSNIKINFILVI